MVAKKHIHEERGVTLAEFIALLGVRNMLATGLISYSADKVACPHKHTFNMETQGEVHECGSVGCIGGYMALVLGKVTPEDAQPAGIRVNRGMSRYVGNGISDGSHSPSLRDLFFPYAKDRYGELVGFSAYTPFMAVDAIDNWINTGDPDWQSVYDKYANR